MKKLTVCITIVSICKLLHKLLKKVHEVFPNLEIFVYLIDGSDGQQAQHMIERMAITAGSVPLTILVQEGEVIRIIVGYRDIKDFIQKIDPVFN